MSERPSESAVGLPADLSRAGSAHELVRAALEACGRLDVLVNNAGTAIAKDSLEFTAEEWERTLTLNLGSVFFCWRRSLHTGLPVVTVCPQMPRMSSTAWNASPRCRP